MSGQIKYVLSWRVGYSGKLQSRVYANALSAQKRLESLKRECYALGSLISAHKVRVIDGRSVESVSLCELTMGIVSYHSNPSPRVINRYYNVTKIYD